MPKPLSNHQQQIPNRDEFISFWEKHRTGYGMLMFYVAWLSGSFALAKHLDPTGRHFVPSLVGTAAYFILTPIIALRIYWRRNDRFVRCPQCRDWIGDDARDVERRAGPGPKWVVISKTGRCTKCGAQMIASGNGEENGTKRDGVRRDKLVLDRE